MSQRMDYPRDNNIDANAENNIEINNIRNQRNVNERAPNASRQLNRADQEHLRAFVQRILQMPEEAWGGNDGSIDGEGPFGVDDDENIAIHLVIPPNLDHHVPGVRGDDPSEIHNVSEDDDHSDRVPAVGEGDFAIYYGVNLHPNPGVDDYDDDNDIPPPEADLLNNQSQQNSLPRANHYQLVQPEPSSRSQNFIQNIMRNINPNWEVGWDHSREDPPSNNESPPLNDSDFVVLVEQNSRFQETSGSNSNPSEAVSSLYGIPSLPLDSVPNVNQPQSFNYILQGHGQSLPGSIEGEFNNNSSVHMDSSPGALAPSPSVDDSNLSTPPSPSPSEAGSVNIGSDFSSDASLFERIRVARAEARRRFRNERGVFTAGYPPSLMRPIPRPSAIRRRSEPVLRPRKKRNLFTSTFSLPMGQYRHYR